jgi:hypothetical protein
MAEFVSLTFLTLVEKLGASSTFFLYGSLQWRRGSLPIISFLKRRDAHWNKSKLSGGKGIMLTKGLRRFSSPIVRDCAVSTGQAPDQWGRFGSD